MGESFISGPDEFAACGFGQFRQWVGRGDGEHVDLGGDRGVKELGGASGVDHVFGAQNILTSAIRRVCIRRPAVPVVRILSLTVK